MADWTIYERFLQELGSAQAGLGLDSDELRALVEARVVGAQAAWPNLALAAGDFSAHLAHQVRDSDDVRAFVSAVHADDLYLALACVRGIEAAIRVFEDRFFPYVDALARGTKGVSANELKQTLRERLFVGTAERRPRLATYRGQGALKNWFRVFASRLLVELAQQTSRTRTVEHSILRERLAHDDIEIEHIRARFRPQFQQALSRALARLTPKDRTVLRQRFVDGLRLEDLATAHGVNRATAVRWLARARASIRDAMRDDLVAELRLSATEFSSLMRLVRSDLDITLSKLLG